ncbi:protein broad-minded isoform X3 [Oryzias latipes]
MTTNMSQLLVKDEVELQSLIKQFLKSISEKITGATSGEAAQEILLHLEETDKNFYSYEFVRYLRQHIESSLGAAVEEEMLNLTLGEGQHGTGSGHDALINVVACRNKDSAEYQQMMQTLKTSLSSVVECLTNKYKESQLRKEETHREREHSQHSSHFTDSCSDSDSSFNQSYTFITQEELQLLAERLEPGKPKEMRREALHVLCRASLPDLLSCESWSTLRRNLSLALNEAELSEEALQFFAKSFSCSPLNVTREMFASLAKNVESSFVSHKLNFPSGSATLDINTPKITRLLKQMRLINDFQKEVASFWIRHPEKYMEDVIESSLSLLSFHHPHGSAEKPLEPIHLLTLLDIKADWFIKWMHGYYSRNVVLRLLERKYKLLVVVAVQQCIHYSEASEGFRGDVSDALAGKQKNASALQSSVYSGKELDFALFVHSVCVLGKLILYANGRKLFPIRIRKHKEPVTLTDLLVILINIMYHHPKPLPSDASHTDPLSPSGLVLELLWMLCEQPDCAAECLHQTAVMEKLLAPVVALLSGQQSTLDSPATTLILIADVLARIANTDRGLALFLYEKNVVGPQGERACTAHIIAQFTLRLLGNGLPSLSGSAVSHSVCGAFIFVCWQMYNTCEGLQVLEPYGLHKAIAAAWRKTSSLPERISEASPETSLHEMPNELIWEETLLDSLLSFAATPRGLLLLQQTGALTQCISYMFSRSTKKLQVSRCEKFGYGVMVTQVATTAPGTVALRDSGFIQELLVQLWSALECGSDDAQLAAPKPTSMDPIDRSCLKPFLSLVNLLSSSQSVWELLHQQPLPNKSEYSLREMPTSIPDLIDRLIAVNSDVKIHSLFHYEQSHTFGLRLLNVLCCSLDSFLLLENQYNICSMLLQSQRDNITDSDINEGEIIVDGLSVERNHVLVRVGVVGGPSERRLPLRSLQEGDQPYPWPMVLSYPVPHFYTLDPPETLHTSQSCEMSAFLTSSKESDENWLKKCQNLFLKAMTSEPHNLTGNVLADLLESVVVHLSNSATECLFSLDQHRAAVKDVKNVELSSVEQLGVDICLKYGSYLKVLGGDARNPLILLLKQIKSFLSKQRRNASSGLLTQQESYPGHDWLASTVFLLMGGDLERSLGLLLRLSSLLASAFIWPARMHACVHLPEEVAGSGIPPVYWCTAHYVEMLLKAELPLVHSAFRMSGFTPSQMCLHWLTQCFWNYLDWSEICLYLCACVLFSPDYQVYLCVAIFRHLQPDILQRTQSQELQIFLKENPIEGFRMSDHLEFMLGLERSYRKDVLTAMKGFLEP